MKPNDLKYPYSWEERKPLIVDRVFFIPSFYSNFNELPPLNLSVLFSRSQPINIEYCSGNGSWILSKALENPDKNWIAVEKKFDRVRKIWSKMKKSGVGNLFIVCGEAHTFTKFYVPDGSIEEVYINFPDPWPKLRHAKNRLLTCEFIAQMQRALSIKGKITFVTDDNAYFEQTIANFNSSQDLKSYFPAPYFVENIEGYGESYFENLWRGEGKTIHYSIYEKVS